MAFDAAVLGLGTMGTFACLELARRKLSVLGLDQFAPPHDRGSHTGDTRVFRIAYAEHPDYVPLAYRAGVLWDQFGREAGITLLHRTGMLTMGARDGNLISGIRASAAAHQLNVEELTHNRIASRFPAFKPPSEWTGVLEKEAGYVDVDTSIRFGLDQAARLGAELHVDTRVEHWEPRGDEFVIRTSSGIYTAKLLIVTAGAWAGRLLSGLSLPLRVLRKVLIWVNPLRPERFTPGILPVFGCGERFFYGIPNIAGKGVKLSIHWSENASPTDIDIRQPDATLEEIQPILEEAAALMPSLAGPLPAAFERVLRTKTCLYTMTPDEHFVIDRHPRLRNVILAAGFSGHGFKFAPAIGEALAELAIDGKSSLPVDFLSLRRFQPRAS